FLTAAANKFHGPKGIGFMFVRSNVLLKSLIVGGAQERGLRAGTESIHDIAGLETAFRLAYEHLDQERTFITQLKTHFISQIKALIPGAVFNGDSASPNSTYTLVNVRLPLKGDKAAMLLFHLDLNGIACSQGSACQSGSSKGSHVLDQVVPADEQWMPSLRFSFSKYNTLEEVNRAVEVLADFVTKD
ncbi:MAG: cysteine desulfurase family protein, partial [Flavobacteriaceae bacterium]